MITVNLNRTEFEYDIHSLLKAFFPKEDVEIYYTKEAHAEEKNVACTNHSAENETESASHFSITYEDKQISITCTLENKKPAECTFAVDFADRAETKNALKENLYHLLEEVTGQSLPWGTLTGIRPTKIPMQLLDEGKTKEEVASYMKKTYLASDEKVDLSIAIAERERALLSQLDYKNGYSLYIGIPFCPSTCLYCSFTSYSIDQYENIVQDYLDALFKELDFVKQAYAYKELQTMYIGGGTPTSLNEQDLEYLLCEINKRFPLSKIKEITVEAGRPDSLNLEKLKILKKYGVTRISINPQSMNDKTLKIIGRNHFAQDIKEKFNLARQAGIDNINMDMICGLPEEGMEELSYTLDEIKKLDPESLTVHALAVKRSSRLNRMKDTYHFGATEEMVSYAARCARDMQMEPYYLYRQKNIPGNLENVGFSKKGKECLYNILIMEELHDIIAVGAGTSSKIVHQEDHQVDRIENLKDIKQYITRIDEIIHRKELKMI